MTNATDIRKQLQSDEAITLEPAQLQALQAEFARLDALASDGKAYRSELLAKTSRAAMLALPGLNGELVDSMCGQLTTKQLETLAVELEQQANKILPLHPQLQVLGNATGEENHGFKF